jgi:hypothetical protein
MGAINSLSLDVRHQEAQPTSTAKKNTPAKTFLLIPTPVLCAASCVV